MKQMKKILAVVLAMVMTLSTSAVVFAATGGPNDKGSIVIDNASKNQEYSIYKLFDLTFDGDDPGAKVAYSYNKTGATDALFAALKDGITDGTTTITSPFTLTLAAGTGSPSDTNPTTGTYVVQPKTGVADDAIISFVQKLIDKTLLTKTAGPVKADATETVTFSNIDLGYYYVESSLGTVITLDSTLANVTLIDKNQTPTWDNKPGDDPKDPKDNDPGDGKVILITDGQGNVTRVKETDAKFGDTVTFSVAVNATKYANVKKEPSDADSPMVAKKVKEYVFADKLPAGFNSPNNFKVFVTQKDGDGNFVPTQLTTSEYRLVQNGNLFNVVVPCKDAWGSNYVIDVQYDAVVNNAAIIAGAGNKNAANFNYNTTDTPFTPNDPFDPTKPPYDPNDPDNPDNNPPGTTPDPGSPWDPNKVVTTTTYVYAIGLNKVDGDNNNAPLAGAKFKADVPVKATGTTGVYEYDPNGTVGGVEMVTDSTGHLVIKGLDMGDYKLTETLAPNGYNMLTSPVEFTVTKDSSTQTILTVPVTGKDVQNFSGVELPATGGMGTTLIYILGGILVALATLTFVVKRKMSRDN